MFTDRFIKLPVRLFSKVQQNLNPNAEDIDTWRKVLPMEICEYGPTNDDDDVEGRVLTVTVVHLKCGDSFIAYMPFEQFEKLLNNHS